MKSFSEFLDGMTDEQLGAHMRDRFTRLRDAAAQGLCAHPAHSYNADNKILRARDAGRARDGGQDPGDQPSIGDPNGNGSGLGSRNLEPTDQPGAQDDPPPSSRAPGTPPLPEREGASLAAHDRQLAADEAREEVTIRHRASANMDGELLAARARRSDPRRVAGMSAAIPGYGRLK